jgi:hypothetical protein
MFVATDGLRITDGQSHCRISDPASGTLDVPLVEIGLHGALINTKLQLEENAYIDVTLVMRDQAPKQLFAHVVSCKDEGMRLRWLHFDPGEEGKLRTLLENYAKSLAGKPTSGSSTRRVVRPKDLPDTQLPAAGGNTGTRRLVRPSSSAITPFSDMMGMPSGAAATEQNSGPKSVVKHEQKNEHKEDSQRVGTRRVLRPSQQPMTPFSEDAPRVPGEDSRTQQVVIEPTDRFEKLIDVRVDNRAAPKKAETTIPEDAGFVQTPAAGNPITPPTPNNSPQPASKANSPSEAQPFSDGGSGAHPVPGGKTAVLNKDGRMDIGASIRTHAKTVRASELAARHDKVRVLNMATIKGLIQEAVEEAAAHLTRSLGEAERKRLLEEAEEGFQERLKEFQAEKQSAEERNKRLNDQLESARKLLEEERKRTIKADQFTVSAEGLGEIEERFSRFLDRTLTAGKVPPDVEEDLRKVVARILDSEREKIREREMEAQNSKIELLERKISRLAGSLEETERARDEAQRFAAFLESQGGGALRNVFTAGIKSEDPNKEKKMALMKGILDENRLLRQSLGIELGKVEAEPAKPAAPEVSAPAASAAHVAEEQVEEESAQQAAEEATESTEANEETSDEPTVNPDDEVWEVKPLSNLSAATNEHGIKRIDVSAVLGKGPPPLERK